MKTSVHGGMKTMWKSLYVVSTVHLLYSTVQAPVPYSTILYSIYEVHEGDENHVWLQEDPREASKLRLGKQSGRNGQNPPWPLQNKKGCGLSREEIIYPECSENGQGLASFFHIYIYIFQPYIYMLSHDCGVVSTLQLIQDGDVVISWLEMAAL
jgi:hypothetical protein